jgi:hypothetical protein
VGLEIVAAQSTVSLAQSRKMVAHKGASTVVGNDGVESLRRT